MITGGASFETVSIARATPSAAYTRVARTISPRPLGGILPTETDRSRTIESLAAIFYLVRKRAGRPAARQAISTICEVLRVVDSPGRTGRMALESQMPDFEDALQYATAVLAQADCLLTRNTVDFPRRGKVRVMTPDDFLRAP